MKKITTKELLESAINELRFSNLQIEYLKSVINEIETITDDVLIKSVIKNTKERHNLDKLIHANLLFKK